MQDRPGGLSCRSNWHRWGLAPVLLLSLFWRSNAYSDTPIEPVKPDLILKNGHILVDRGEQSTIGHWGKWEQALSIQEGTLLSIGTDKILEKEAGPKTKIIDLKGRVVLAGFNDALVELPLDKGKSDFKKAFLDLQDQALKFGITSIQMGPILDDKPLEVLQALIKDNQLHLRVAVWGDLEKYQEFLALKDKFKSFEDESVNLTGVKGTIDGTVNAHTAALSQPYSDDGNIAGTPLFSQEKLDDLVLNVNRSGLPVYLHAAGDEAVAMAVTAIAAARKQLFNSHYRNRIEGMEIVPSAVFSRFQLFGIVAAFQPNLLAFATETGNYYDARLGGKGKPNRLNDTFAFHNFYQAGVHLAFGSGTQLTNPLLHVFEAVYQESLDGKSSKVWPAKSRLSIEQAIQSVTIEPAYATHEEHIKGSIREGKLADLVVLEQDPFKTKGIALTKIPVVMTIIDGKIVYDGSVPTIKSGP